MTKLTRTIEYVVTNGRGYLTMPDAGKIFPGDINSHQLWQWLGMMDAAEGKWTPGEGVPDGAIDKYVDTRVQANLERNLTYVPQSLYSGIE